MNKGSNEQLYYSYLVLNGFDPDKYNKVLEVGTKETKAISNKICGTETFLLSEDLNYDRMAELGLFGARGYIDNDGINIPKSIETEWFMSYFGAPVLTTCPLYPKPTMNDFDVILCPAYYERLFYLLKEKTDIFIGACMDNGDPRIKRVKLNLAQFKLIVSKMYGREMLYSEDTLESHGKQLFMLKHIC